MFQFHYLNTPAAWLLIACALCVAPLETGGQEFKIANFAGQTLHLLNITAAPQSAGFFSFGAQQQNKHYEFLVETNEGEGNELALLRVELVKSDKSVWSAIARACASLQIKCPAPSAQVGMEELATAFRRHNYELYQGNMERKIVLSYGFPTTRSPSDDDDDDDD